MVNAKIETLRCADIKIPENALRTVDTKTEKGIAKYKQIKNSIEQNGLLNAIAVRYDDDGVPYVVDGVHRLTILTELGAETIPCVIVQDTDADDALFLSIVGNLQRVDQRASDVTRALKAMIDKGYSFADMRNALSLSDVSIMRYLQLRKLPTDVQSMVDSGKMTLQNAVSLSGIIGLIDGMPETLAEYVQRGVDEKSEVFKANCDKIKAQLKPEKQKTENGEAVFVMHGPVFQRSRADEEFNRLQFQVDNGEELSCCEKSQYDMFLYLYKQSHADVQAARAVFDADQAEKANRQKEREAKKLADAVK